MAIDPSSVVGVREITLERYDINSAYAVAGDLMRRGKWRDTHSLKADETIHSLHTYIVGLPEKVIDIDRWIPKTWWDAFKLRWFPKWALKRWPAQQEHIYYYERIYKAVCPHINMPEQRDCFAWLADHDI